MRLDIRSVYAATVFAIILVTIITVFGELYPPFKNFLKENFKHHWIGKGIISILGFLGAAILYKPSGHKDKKIDYWKYTKKLIMIFILSALILLVFFTMHYFGLM